MEKEFEKWAANKFRIGAYTPNMCGNTDYALAFVCWSAATKVAEEKITSLEEKLALAEDRSAYLQYQLTRE
jgi:hypothetical protein